MSSPLSKGFEVCFAGSTNIGLVDGRKWDQLDRVNLDLSVAHAVPATGFHLRSPPQAERDSYVAREHVRSKFPAELHKQKTYDTSPGTPIRMHHGVGAKLPQTGVRRHPRARTYARYGTPFGHQISRRFGSGCPDLPAFGPVSLSSRQHLHATSETGGTALPADNRVSFPSDCDFQTSDPERTEVSHQGQPGTPVLPQRLSSPACHPNPSARRCGAWCRMRRPWSQRSSGAGRREGPRTAAGHRCMRPVGSRWRIR